MVAVPRGPAPPDGSPVERASPTDRAFLAMDTGGLPEQVAVILVLEGTLDEARMRCLLAERIAAVPRLRQRLVRTPVGCGGPIWVDDPGFDLTRHIRVVACREPGDERALLDTALPLVTTRLPAGRPPWSVTFVTGLERGRVALVVVLHHVLADGVGGLAVLLNLVDQAAAAPAAAPWPRQPPRRAQLMADALRRRLRALRQVRRSWQLLRASMAAGGGVRPPRAVPCSLVQPTGPRRRLDVVRVGVAPLSAAAHRRGATTNDAVLVAVAGALDRVLVARHDRPVGRLAVAVPVSGRRDGDPRLGNMVSPLLVTVPTAGEVGDRLRRVAAAVRAGKKAARGPAPIAVLGWLFRPLAAMGAYRWYLGHQRRMHTLVSHVRGPDTVLTLGGVPISAAFPVAVAENGNMTVYFEVLSYAGTMTITAITDPHHFPDPDVLIDALRAELAAIVLGPEEVRPGTGTASPAGRRRRSGPRRSAGR